MITYRQATTKDLPAICHLFSNAFKQDPAFHHGFKPSIRKKASITQMINRLFRVYVKGAMKHQYCFVGIKDKTIVSAALMADPDSKEPSLLDYITSGGLALLPSLNPFKLMAFFDFFDKAKQPCKKQFPNGWYVDMLGVSPDHQGLGLGSQMIQNCLIPFVDSQHGQAITLITNTELNCRFYKKNGFKVIGRSLMKVNDIAIPTWNFVTSLQ